MSGPRTPRAVRIATAVVAAIDRIAGSSRRYRAGDGLVEAFADEARDAHRDGGAARVAVLTLRAALDLALDLVRQLRPRSRPPRRRYRSRGDSSVQSVLHDLRLALRNVARQPGFAAAVVLTLGLGIAANSAIFTLVDAALLRPLPYAEPERLVRVWAAWRGGERGNVNPLDAMDWRRESPAIEDLAAWTRTSQAVTGAGEPRMAGVGFATASFFDVLGVDAARGRAFGPEHEREERKDEIVLADGFWRRALGADPGVVGTKLVVNGTAATVIGVLPRGFASPGTSAASEPDLWRPFVVDPADSRGGHYMKAVGRLRPGATLDEARAQLAEISRRLEAENPETNHELLAVPEPLAESIAGEGRPALLLLMAAVGVVLLVACANVAHLLLARAAGREREMALRGALGAGRARLVRQLLVESLLFSGLAAALGVGGGWLMIRALPATLAAELPAVLALALDARVVLFTLALSVATTVLFGLAPALAATRSDLRSALGADGRATPARGRLRSGLLVAETALALVLLVSASLLLESFAKLGRVAPGFDAENVLTFRLSLPRARYGESAARRGFYRELEARLAALPGVAAAGAVNMAPMTDRSSCDSFGLFDRPAPPVGEEPCAESRVATPGYFDAMAIPLLAGRSFDGGDVDSAAPVLVVSETMAKRYWPDGDAVGQLYRWGSVRSEEPWFTIVGVVGDVKFFGLDADAAPEVYIPSEQGSSFSMTFALRTEREPAALAAEARSTVAALDPELPLFEVSTTGELVARSTGLRRFRTQLLSGFAAVALLLALVGVHGVMAFDVAERRREIGIRISLGAGPGEVRWQVVRRGLRAVLAGVAVGLVGALAATRLLAGLLYGVEPTDATAFVVAPLALVTTALAASFLPARRATRVDPLEAIRAE